MNKLSSIDVSLSRGQLYGKKQFIVGWIAIISAIILMLIGSISFVLAVMDWDSQIFIVAILCVIIGIAFLVTIICQFQKDKKTKKEVSLWIKDAIQIRAIAEVMDSFRAGFQPIGVKICVKFYIGEIAYVRESTVKPLGGKIGYSSAFKRYLNRPIEILYSPMYDEVLILKN